MRQLILVRHGKSSWEHDVTDRERPLKQRGINDTQLVAEKFKTLGIEPSFAYSSVAERAFRTAMRFLKHIKFNLDCFAVQETLYDFAGDHVAAFVKHIDNAHNTVILFGHNYAFTHLANKWGNKIIDNIPTAGLVHLAFDTEEWGHIHNDIGTTKNIIFPKHLKSSD